MDLYQVLSILASLALFAFVIDFIRRGLLKEKYSVLWLAATLAITVLAVKKSLLDTIARQLGVAYPPSLLFLVAFVFVLLIMLHFSVVISILHEKNKILAQELTLLKNAFKEAGHPIPGDDGGGDGSEDRKS
jgi:hypothetical protein